MEVENEPRSPPLPQSQTSKLNFLDFTIEIRLKIYEELLVAPEPLSVIFTSSPDDPAQLIAIREDSDCFSPQILRVSKQFHHEATPLLYGNNRFHLSRLHKEFGDRLMPCNEGIVKFLTQVGNYNASLIRHLGIYFPLTRNDSDPDPVKTQALDFIHDKCTSLTTVRILLWNSCNLDRSSRGVKLDEAGSSSLFAEDLKRIDAQLKRTSSLREISLDFCIWGPWEISEIDDKVRQLIHDCGWKVQVTKEEEEYECELGRFGWFD
ncbi:uncharacterized protein Bfra_010582 [Botrytis fragariae]|uniref:Uncharacterized protein n=1 Tax=Botrytis fragariae TaxID=1964551 RepID=A0A8H6AGQ1_9HELO|nr:uncharacterized protein Bfra_010582 [Botrytis fragariae]KAF5867607.1 hypothetical protein Bfra_010582 [Botrytis fragariae]